jgi:2-oxoglutarate ferredoxin oxidoreductase subunit beta
MVVMLLDNNVYGLTKNQTSPTSRKGSTSNTHPQGSVLDPINPIQTTLGIANVSFVAQTVDWNPAHLLATLKAAHEHPGLAFVRILQRCPHFKEGLFDCLQSDPAGLCLLKHPDGIAVDPAIERILTNQREHDPTDLDAARVVAGRDDAIPVGLLYRNVDADRYDEFTVRGLATARDAKIQALEAELDRYQI